MALEKGITYFVFQRGHDVSQLHRTTQFWIIFAKVIPTFKQYIKTIHIVEWVFLPNRPVSIAEYISAVLKKHIIPNNCV